MTKISLASAMAYEKIGFEHEGVRRSQFIVDGKYVDDVFMTYWVDESIRN